MNLIFILFFIHLNVRNPQEADIKNKVGYIGSEGQSNKGEVQPDNSSSPTTVVFL